MYLILVANNYVHNHQSLKSEIISQRMVYPDFNDSKIISCLHIINVETTCHAICAVQSSAKTESKPAWHCVKVQPIMLYSSNHSSKQGFGENP